MALHWCRGKDDPRYQQQKRIFLGQQLWFVMANDLIILVLNIVPFRQSTMVRAQEGSHQQTAVLAAGLPMFLLCALPIL